MYGYEKIILLRTYVHIYKKSVLRIPLKIFVYIHKFTFYVLNFNKSQ